MKEILRKLPVPMVGLILALAATGNLVLSYGEIYRNVFGVLSAIILISIIMKILMFKKGFMEALDNPVVLSVFPTLSMGIMLLATYVKPLNNTLSFIMWLFGLILHIFLIAIFTKKYLLKLNIKQVFPSWFIVYVGIAVASITAPAFSLVFIGQMAFWFGIVSYVILLPIVIKRVFIVKEMPEPTLPTIVIFTAPVALCLAGYMNSFPEKNMIIVYGLLIISQLSYLFVLTQLPKLLKLQFYPSYSAFTFPMVISAMSLKLTNGFLVKSGNEIAKLQYLVKFEEILAIVLVIYVLFRYIQFLLKKPAVAK